MKDFTFRNDLFRQKYKVSFETALFNREDHLISQSPNGWHSFGIQNQKDSQINCLVHFHLEGTVASSPLKSPFGGFEFDNDLDPECLFDFIGYVEGRLSELGVKKIIIKNPPLVYDSQKISLQQVFLLNRKYAVDIAEISAIINVHDPLEMDKWESDKLKKSQHAALNFQQLPLSDLPMVYNFISNCFQMKDRTLSMTLEELKNVSNLFHEDFLLFVVKENDRIAGATIAIRINSEILYTFYIAHDPELNAISPVVFLVHHLRNYCVEQKFRLLDLGTSAKEGLPNFPLLGFKLRLGALPSPKLTFIKTIG